MQPRKTAAALWFEFLTCLIILFTVFSAQAQHNALSQQIASPRMARPFPLTLTYCLDQIENWHETKLDSANHYLKAAEQLVQERKTPLAYAIVQFWKARLYYKQVPTGILERALTLAKISASLFTLQKQTYWAVRANNLVTSVLLTQYKLEKAETHLNKTLRNAALLNRNEPKVLSLWGDLLTTKATLADYKDFPRDSVKTYLEQALVYYKKANDRKGMANLYLNLATLTPSSDLALSHCQQAIALYQTIAYAQGLRNAYLDLGRIYQRKYHTRGRAQDFDLSLQAFTSAQAQHSTQSYSDSELDNALGELYHQKASSHPQQRQSLLDSAQFFYVRAFYTATKTGNRELLNRAANNRIAICEFRGNCKSLALEIDSAYQQVEKKQAKAVEEAYQSLNLFEKNQIQSIAKQRQSILLLSAGMAILGLLIIFGFWYQRNYIRNLNKELELKMEALRAQMNPHFISNVLNAIDSLVNHQRNAEASRYIIQFSRLSRLVLNHSRYPLITLADELLCLQYFLNLEKLRLGEMFNYKIITDPSLDVHTLAVPPMILQPFVENAIWHGIQKKQTPGECTIKVWKLNNAFLECIVEDDGIGRKKSKALDQQSVLERRSWGLTITEERLSAIRKIKGSALLIEDLYDTEGQATGTRVTVRIPISIYTEHSFSN